MADDTRTTRRALLGAGIGALVASVAHALGRPGAAEAADGDVMRAGQDLLVTHRTSLTNTANQDSVFLGQSVLGIGIVGKSSTGSGIYGASDTGTGVEGYSTEGTGIAGASLRGNGVRGFSRHNRGVAGESNDESGVIGTTNANGPFAGVVGVSSLARGYGVFGFNTGAKTVASLAGPMHGVAVEVPNAPGYVGVIASAGAAATALQVTGRATLNRSGRVSIAAGRTFVEVAVPGGLEGAPLAFANVLVNRAGVYVQSVVPNASTGKIRINLNKVASASSSTPASWLVLG